MEKIIMSEVENEIKMLKEKFNGVTRMTQKIKDEIEKLGYELYELGTGDSAYTSSMQIKEMNIKSRKFLNGKFVSIGCFNIKHHGSVIYRAYIKEVI